MVYASHNLSPYFVEGTKSFAYEVATQIPIRPRPHCHSGRKRQPAARSMESLPGANCAGGCYLQMPKLHAIQAEAVMPIACGDSWAADWTPGGTTIAGGIAVGSPPRLRQSLRAIRGVRRDISRGDGRQHSQPGRSCWRLTGRHIRRADIGSGLRRTSTAHRAGRSGQRTRSRWCLSPDSG